MVYLKKRGLATDGDGEARRGALAPAAIERLKKGSWEMVNAGHRT